MVEILDSIISSSNESDKDLIDKIQNKIQEKKVSIVLFTEKHAEKTISKQSW